MMINKIKDKITGRVTKEYRVCSVFNDAAGKDMFYLCDDSSSYKFGSYNFSFIKQFAERLRTSGHKVIYEENIINLIHKDCGHAYCSSCAGCVLDTGIGCLYDSEQGFEDKEDADGI